MSAASKKAHRKLKTQLRQRRRAATNAAERLQADREYQDGMRARGFEFDATSKLWIRSAALEARRQKKTELREYALSVRKELG